MRLQRQGEQAELVGFVLAVDVSAQAWMSTLLQDEQPAQSYGRLLLPGAKAPVAIASRGKPVCTCFSVTDSAINDCLRGMTDTPGGAGLLASPQERLLALQDKLQCGTNCGSCVPELKRLIHSKPPAHTRAAAPETAA